MFRFSAVLAVSISVLTGCQTTASTPPALSEAQAEKLAVYAALDERLSASCSDMHVDIATCLTAFNGGKAPSQSYSEKLATPANLVDEDLMADLPGDFELSGTGLDGLLDGETIEAQEETNIS